MRIRHTAFLLCLATLGACTPSVTGEDIERGLEQQLQSVEGPWSGTSYGSTVLTLSFQLQKGSGSAVSGSGTMKEAAAAAAVPITVTGTYVRPRLTLTINGMVFEGHAVQGSFAGDYTSAAGVLANLNMTGSGYSKQMQVLLSEG